MASCLPCLVVLMLGTLLSAQIASSNQQINAARVPSTFVGFDDIVSRVEFKEPSKNVYKREISEDSTISDESNYENATSDIPPLTIEKELTMSNVSLIEAQTEEVKEVSNELDDSTNAHAGSENTSPEESSVSNGEKVEETVPNEVSIGGDYDAEDAEVISDGNMVVGGAGSPEVLGKLMADEEGSGDNETDSEEEENNLSGTTTFEPSNAPEQQDPDEIDISGNAHSEVTEPSDYPDEVSSEEKTPDISIDSASEETADPPDETPIPDPIPEKEDSTTKDFKEEELIRVNTDLSAAPVKTESEEYLPVDVVEGSGEGFGIEGTTDHDNSEERVETEPTIETTEPPQVPVGRNFNPVVESVSTEHTTQATSTVPQGPDDTEDIDLKKAILSTGVGAGKEEGINEIIMKEGESAEDNANKSSTGSYIVLGAIMMTIVVLVAYTVVKSRRQKKSRRSGNITKVEEEDPGREMKEVDKLLAPRTNGFSASNGGPLEDEKTPLKSFKADFIDVSPMKREVVPDKVGGGLTDVIVENVPRLSTAPMANGKAPDEGEDDQDSWVQGDGKALESTKIKMYIDEDSIPKTPIMIVNRGSTPNEV